MSALSFLITQAARKTLQAQDVVETRIELSHQVESLHKIYKKLIQSNQRSRSYSVSIGEISIFVENANKFLNVNRSTFDELVQLCLETGIENDQARVIADSILDWIDSDSEVRSFGAEDDYYQALPTPYSCRNRKIEALNELGLIRGLSRSTLAKLEDHISFSSTGINFNQTSKEVTNAFLQNEEITTLLLEYRRENSMTRNSLKTLFGDMIYESLMNRISFSSSNTWKLTIRGHKNDIELKTTEWITTN